MLSNSHNYSLRQGISISMLLYKPDNWDSYGALTCRVNKKVTEMGFKRRSAWLHGLSATPDFLTKAFTHFSRYCFCFVTCKHPTPWRCLYLLIWPECAYESSKAWVFPPNNILGAVALPLSQAFKVNHKASCGEILVQVWVLCCPLPQFIMKCISPSGSQLSQL